MKEPVSVCLKCLQEICFGRGH